MEKRSCELCLKPIKAFTATKDFKNRPMHKKCWKLDQSIKQLQTNIHKMVDQTTVNEYSNLNKHQ